MSEMNMSNPMSIDSPRALSNRIRLSRAQSATSPRSTQNISPSQNPHHSVPDIDDGATPNAEKLYTDDGHSAFNVDPNAPVLSGGVGEETMREIEMQREREEEERRQAAAAKGAAGGGNRFVGGFVLGLKNALRPRWGGAGAGRQTARDPFPAFPLAVHEPEPDDDDDDNGRYDQSQYDRERGHHPGDVEHHAGASRQGGQQPEHGLRHRTSYQSLDSPSEAHPTTEWHDDGTTAVDHTGYNYSQYPINYDAHGNPIPPLIPPASSRPQSNLPNSENAYSSYNYPYPPNYVPSQSNYIPANSNGAYHYTVGSPVLADIKPASDYAKMDIPPSSGPSEVSFNTYLNRIRRVVDHVNSLPWVAERVTVDYYPAGIRGAKLEKKEREKERIRKQDEEILGPGGIFGDGIGLGRKDRRPILSWYDRNKMGGLHVNPGEIDLTAGSPPQPQPVQAQPSVGQVTDNIGRVTPYSPLAPATIPPIAVTPSGITVGMTPRPGDAVPLAPGLYPSSDANAASSQPLVPPSSLEPMYTGGSTPGGAGATVRLTTSPPNATFDQPFDHPSSPGYTHLTMPGGAPSSQANGLSGMRTPGLDTGSVTIDVVPPSTTASASAMSRTPVIPGQTGSTIGNTNMPTAGPTPVIPFVPAPSAAVSPPRSTTHSHTRSPSVPITSSQNPRSPSLRHTRTHARTPSAGSVSSRRAPNPNTPVHFFPANVPATSAPPRTPIPSAPPTPAQNQGQSQNPGPGPGPSLNVHNVNNLNGYTPLAPGIMAARSEGGHSDRSGKSGLSAMTGKSGRSWVVVNGYATPSSSGTNDSRDLPQNQNQNARNGNRRNGSVTGNDHGYGYGGSYAGSVSGYGATPRVMTRGLNNNRRDTFETAQTPVSVNPSTHFETPVVSTYAGEEGQGYGRNTGGGYGYGQGGHGGIYDRKGKGKAAPASVQTVSDTGSSPSGSEGIYDLREQRKMFQHYERQQHQQRRGNSGNGRTQVQGGLGGGPSFSYGKSQSHSTSPGPAYGYPYSVPRSRQP